MVEIKEVLRLWMGGAKKKRIAAQLTIDVKTVRRYIQGAREAGLAPGTELSDERLGIVLQIFTPHVSRYRFVYPCFAESTETAIEACEAAWECNVPRGISAVQKIRRASTVRCLAALRDPPARIDDHVVRAVRATTTHCQIPSLRA